MHHVCHLKTTVHAVGQLFLQLLAPSITDDFIYEARYIKLKYIQKVLFTQPHTLACLVVLLAEKTRIVKGVYCSRRKISLNNTLIYILFHSKHCSTQVCLGFFKGATSRRGVDPGGGSDIRPGSIQGKHGTLF